MKLSIIACLLIALACLGFMSIPSAEPQASMEYKFISIPTLVLDFEKGTSKAQSPIKVSEEKANQLAEEGWALTRFELYSYDLGMSVSGNNQTNQTMVLSFERPRR